ncbi:MAG: alpha-glucosidase C-terminal domain-containing protein [Anaerolineales bacterium]|nr:alpha-glucosidase C-terminal domain-containing protein [Anaerolineales bacterium]
MKNPLLLVLLLILLLIACQETDPATPTASPTETAPAINTAAATATALPPTSTPLPEPTATPDPFVSGTNGFPWWNDVVFYEIFVRSFYDSDGDGIGDLNGVIEKLDYLNDGDPTTADDLGVTGIWLMPIMVSPSYHGYDVVDYFQVDPDYGTNEDFLRLMDEAHARGIHVIVDFVMNHTSTQHPWFIDSQNPDSDKRDWYIWAEENPGYRGPDGQPVWHSDPSGFYYGVFWSGMPDLNFENPDVTAAMFEAAKFWLEEMNVDGFRLDAIKHMIEEGEGQQNTRSTHDWLQEFYTFYKSVDPNALTVGEAWTATQQVVDYTGDEVDIAFQFDLALDILNGSLVGIPAAFYRTQQEVYNAFPANQYATFITNHDQNRVMSQLQEDEAKARLAASILLTGTGVPFIYYGEEIGMTGIKPDEDIRLPLQWASNSPSVGFTTGTPWRPAAADFPVRSIERQDADPDSLLNHYRALIHLRNEHEALRVGDWTLIEANSGRLYTFLRQTENETILVVMNFNRNPVSAEDYGLAAVAGTFDGAVTAVSLYGNPLTGSPEINSDGSFNNYTPFDEIPPQSTHIMLLSPEG